MMKALLVILLLSTTLIIGCVEQPYSEPAGGETPGANETDQPSGIPIPDEDDLDDGEPPEFPF